MPTDATGTPTSLGIRTYNTSADAPSGLGFNGAMADIDALLVARTKAFTAAGDMLYATGANTPARLPIGSSGQILTVVGGLPVWSPASGAVTLRKNSPTAVNTTVTATDLLAGSITLPVLTATQVVRLTAVGDWLQNSGGTVAPPRFQLILGGTTLIDTGVVATETSGATRMNWSIEAKIFNLGATNSQFVQFNSRLSMSTGASAGTAAFTSGTGILSNPTGTFVQEGDGEATSAVDTSVGKTLVLNVINGSASAAYETKLFGALVEVI